MRRSIVLIIVLIIALAGVAWAAPSNQDFNTLLLNTRANLETLANKVFGGGDRPTGWTFNINNLQSTSYIPDLWFDHELLADKLYDKKRPEGWIGAPGTRDPSVVARNVRSDLELAADQVYGKENRPAEWRGGLPLTRCDRTLQNLVMVLTNVFNVKFQTDNKTINYCATIAAEAEGQVIKLALSDEATTTGATDLILAVRGNLERLADEKLGLNNRPSGWLGNKDKASPTLTSDISLDLELLANTLLANVPRPAEWIGGPLPTNPILTYRALRHDLELLANAVNQNPRPRGWQGTDPFVTCDSTLQNLSVIVQKAYNFDTKSVDTNGNYCANLAQAANQSAENPPIVEVTAEAPNARFMGESRYAFAYLDPAATQYMGAMPPGTKFRAWYRNFDKSTMMFVSGDKFAVYIDLRWTTLPPDVFSRLPTMEGVKPLTFCDAKWCNGPGPTPTPTGSGAIASLLNQGTPPAAPEVGQGETGAKQQVSWNYIRVGYLQDNATTKTAQVTLEICADTTQTDCEPVTQIFDKAAGAPKPVLSQMNNLNVYEFPYGYSANLQIESKSRFSPDVWISDPTIR